MYVSFRKAIVIHSLSVVFMILSMRSWFPFVVCGRRLVMPLVVLNECRRDQKIVWEGISLIGKEIEIQKAPARVTGLGEQA